MNTSKQNIASRIPEPSRRGVQHKLFKPTYFRNIKINTNNFYAEIWVDGVCGGSGLGVCVCVGGGGVGVEVIGVGEVNGVGKCLARNFFW